MLTGKQKKFIKKNIKKLPIEEVAKEIGTDPKEIDNYLKNIWRKDKFAKFHKKINQSSSLPVNIQPGWFKNNWYIILGLIVLVLAVYANGLFNAFVSDDVNWILNNPNVGNFANLLKFPDRPIIWLIFAIAHAIGGLSPIFYRLPNVLIHAGSVVAIFILLSILMNRKTAIFTALIFAVHPILVESVTWIAGGSQAGLGLTFLLSFIFYVLSSKSKKLYTLSIFFFVMSYLFSEKAVSLIFIFPLYEMAFGSIQRNWKRTLPYLSIGLITIIILFTKVGGRVSGLQTYNYVQPGFDNPFLKIPTAITEYLRLMFWPNDLSLYRPDTVISWFQYFVRLGIFLTLLTIAGISYWKPIFGKLSKHVFFWITFFVITLLPTLTPLRFASTVAERYVYLGSLGIFTLIGILLAKLSDRGKMKIWIYTIFVIMMAALFTRTVIRNHDWLNEDNLWIASAKVAPENPNVLLNLGDMYTRHKEYQKAIDFLTKAIQIKPDYGDAYHNLANVHVILYDENKDTSHLTEAINNYQSAIKYNPVLWQSYQSLAYIYFNLKMYDKSIEYLNQAIKINPTNLTLQYNLSLIYLNLGNKDKATEMLSNILKVDPNNSGALNAMKQISSP